MISLPTKPSPLPRSLHVMVSWMEGHFLFFSFFYVLQMEHLSAASRERRYYSTLVVLGSNGAVIKSLAEQALWSIRTSGIHGSKLGSRVRFALQGRWSDGQVSWPPRRPGASEASSEKQIITRRRMSLLQERRERRRTHLLSVTVSLIDVCSHVVSAAVSLLLLGRQ